MKTLELPQLICKIDSYIQSIEGLQILIYILALVGLLFVVGAIINAFRGMGR
jgi:hypothetical protein